MDVVINGVAYAPAPQRWANIGIAITTHNRQAVLDTALEHQFRYFPYGALVDHADGVTVEKHLDNAPRNERRKA